MTASKFTLAPSDRSVPFSGLVDFHRKHNPSWDYAVLAPTKPDDEEIIHVSWLEFARAVHRAAHIINPIVNGKGAIGTGNVVAIFAVADSIVYQALVLAVSRSGNIPLPMSNRNSAAAIVNLIEKTSCHHVIYGGGSAVKHIGDEARRQVDEKAYRVDVIPVPTVEQLFPALGHESPLTTFEWYPEIPGLPNDKTGVILHSSGSTGLPKPIHMKESFLQNEFNLPYIRNAEEGAVFGVVALPPFHAMGFYTQVMMPLSSGITAAFWAPSDPVPVATPETTLAAFQLAKVTMCMTVPSFLVTWARDEAAVAYLSTLDRVLSGGGPLTEEVGDYLVKKGVHLISGYGGTEFGLVTDFRWNPNKRAPEDWAWLSFAEQIRLRWVPQSDDLNGTFELQFIDGEHYHSAIHNLDTEDGPVYSTSDLFIPHPTKPKLWKIIGRLDDQITLATGEKINPAPIQDIVLESPLVKGAVLVGRAKNQVAVIVEPSTGYEIDPADQKALAKYRNDIWSSVESANRASAAFARIFKEAILVASTHKPLPQTPKGTVAHKAAVKLYEPEIEELYDTLEKAKGNDFPLPDSWTEGDLKIWLSKGVAELLERSVLIDRDLFEQGGDSLTATFLRNRILGAMRRSGLSAIQQASHHVDQNVVFTHPTIVLLAKHIVKLVRSPKPTTADTAEEAVQQMLTLIDRYTSSIPSGVRLPRETVLLTGSTGALGSLLLSQMLADERVERVWAVNRPAKGKTVEQRQRESFIDKDIDVSLLNHSGGKLIFVEAELSEENLGLDKHLYRQISSTTTLIIHNAWRLDFNLSVNSFESHIKGTRNLVDIAISSPIAPYTRILFTSSVGALGGWRDPAVPVPEEPILDAHLSVGTGYGEAKLVGEKILEEASRKAGIQTANFRVGQLCGSENGFWSTTDWVPIIVASSVQLGCLPDALGNISWVPLHEAAKAILDVGLNREKTFDQTLHVYHPRPVLWTSIFQAISRALEPITGGKRLPVVPFSEWFKKLEAASPDDYARIPALKLLPFYGSFALGDDQLRHSGADPSQREVFQMVILSTQKIRRVSPTMRDLAPIGVDDAARWIEYWTRKGLFGTQKSV